MGKADKSAGLTKKERPGKIFLRGGLEPQFEEAAKGKQIIGTGGVF